MFYHLVYFGGGREADVFGVTLAPIPVHPDDWTVHAT